MVLQGVLEVSDHSQNSRLGSALAQIPDMNGDGFTELVVGAPLEDNHQGAVYVFHGQGKTIQLQYRQVTSSQAQESKLDVIHTDCANARLFCFSSVCLRLVFLQVCSILAKAFTASWTSMQMGLLISQWEQWELPSSSGQSIMHKQAKMICYFKRLLNEGHGFRFSEKCLKFAFFLNASRVSLL